MEFEGLVLKLLPMASGVGSRGEWTKQEVVFEQAGEFGKKICVSFWGDRARDAADLKEGDRVSVSANVESREFNGKWYTEVRAWKITRTQSAVPSASSSAGAASGGFHEGMMSDISADTDTVSGSDDGYDDLPF